jgi:hypothetical protein
LRVALEGIATGQEEIDSTFRLTREGVEHETAGCCAPLQVPIVSIDLASVFSE